MVSVERPRQMNRAERAARELVERAVRRALPRDVVGLAIGAGASRILIASPLLTSAELLALARRSVGADAGELLTIYKADQLSRGATR
jgi:hypothetical protein